MLCSRKARNGDTAPAPPIGQRNPLVAALLHNLSCNCCHHLPLICFQESTVLADASSGWKIPAMVRRDGDCNPLGWSAALLHWFSVLAGSVCWLVQCAVWFSVLV